MGLGVAGCIIATGSIKEAVIFAAVFAVISLIIRAAGKSKRKQDDLDPPDDSSGRKRPDDLQVNNFYPYIT